MTATVVRRHSGRLIAALGLMIAVLVAVGLIVRAGPSQPASATVEVGHRCSIADGQMTATGTIRNLLSEPNSVRLVWLAASTAGFDPPIERGYTVNLGPDEAIEFEHPIVSGDSIANDVVVDDDYSCSVTVE